MNEQEIINGNKLIAVFMGGNDLGNGFNNLPIPNNKIIISNKCSKFYDELEYNSSWDWLMLIIEKIERECGFHISIQPESCTITKYFILSPLFITNYSRGIAGNTKEVIVSAYGDCSDSKILGVFECVIKFIKWYNDINNKVE